MQKLTFIIALLLAIGDTEALGGTKLVVFLDVPQDKAPDFLCVITTYRACDPGSENMPSKCRTTELGDLLSEPSSRTLENPFRLAGSLDANKVKPEVSQAITAFQAISGNACSSFDHPACRPTVDLSTYASGGRVVCGGRSGGGSRVAIVDLDFSSSIKSGVERVTFGGGNTATLTLHDDVPATTKTFIQLLGGHYAPSVGKAHGTLESIVLPLQPRCTTFLAELPSHLARVSRVTLTSRSLGRRTCVPPDDSSQTLTIEIPHTSVTERKVLGVDYATDVRPTYNEAVWTTSLPSHPLKVGVRSIQFSWRRPIDCNADRWSEDSKTDGTWDQICPRATIPGGSRCAVFPKNKGEACDYVCKLEENLPSQSLPIPVQFDRVRVAPVGPENGAELVAYSWKDQIDYSGQVLTSHVAPADRRVMLEFLDNSDWVDVGGDKIDAIRVVNRGSSDQLDLSQRGKDKPPPAWTALSTPDRTCTDRLRIAVFGTRVYDELTRPVENGALVLERPFKHRSTFHPYLIAGTGIVYYDGHLLGIPDVELGIGVNTDLAYPYRSWLPLLNRIDARSLSLNAEITAQLTQTLFRSIESPADRNGFGSEIEDLRRVNYARFDARGTLEWAALRRFGFAIGGSVGLGTPLSFDDDASVGGIRWSGSVEGQVIGTLIPNKIWLIPVVGLRKGEEHYDFTTDFTGQPTPFRRKSVLYFWAFRLRIRIG